MFYIPEDENLPNELHDVRVNVELSDWQGAEPDVGINTGYYETIILTPADDDSLISVLEEHEEYIIETYNDELQDDDGSIFEEEPPEIDDNPTPPDGWGQ